MPEHFQGSTRLKDDHSTAIGQPTRPGDGLSARLADHIPPGPLLIAGVCAIFAMLAFRVLFVENAVVFHDEYLYKAASDHAIDQAMLLERRLTPVMPNRLYLLLIGAHSHFDQNAYVVAGLLNVLAYLAAAVPLWAITSMAGLAGYARTGAVLLALLLPFGLYTKYFMPEAWYFAPFLASQALLMHGLLRGRWPSILLAGVTIAVLYFIKPHASLVLGTSVLVIGLYAWRAGTGWWGALRALGALALGFAVAFLALRGGLDLLMGDHAMVGVYGTMVDGSLRNLLNQFLENPLELVGTTAYVLSGHLLFLFLLYGLPIVAAVLALRVPANPDGRPTSLLAIIALVNVVTLIAVSVLFTVSVNEIGRVHMRYYGFAFSLLIPLLFLVAAAPPRRDRLIAAGAAGLTAVMGVLLVHGYSDIVPIATASDAPDIAIVRLPLAGIAVLALPAVAAAALLAAGHRAWKHLAAVFVLAFSLTDAVLVTRLIGTAFNNDYARGEEARVVTAIVPADQRNEVLVVGRNRDATSKFFFNYRATPFHLHREDGAKVLTGEIPNEARWVVTLHQSIRVPATLEPVVALPRVGVYRVPR